MLLLKVVPYQGNSLFAVSVSEKVAKSAVVRNKLRRQSYRVLQDYTGLVRKGLLVRISWKKVPKSIDEISGALKNILNKFVTK